MGSNLSKVGTGMNHKHEVFKVITEYRRDKKAKVLAVICTDCEEYIPKLVDLFQEGENKAFEAYGNSPVVFTNHNIEWVQDTTYIHAEDPRVTSTLTI